MKLSKLVAIVIVLTIIALLTSCNETPGTGGILVKGLTTEIPTPHYQATDERLKNGETLGDAVLSTQSQTSNVTNQILTLQKNQVELMRENVVLMEMLQATMRKVAINYTLDSLISSHLQFDSTVKAEMNKQLLNHN